MNHGDAKVGPMRYSAFVMVIVFLMMSRVGSAQAIDKITIGQKAKIHSKILEKEMRLSIHLPDDYDETAERYPVLFTFQTHFEQVSGAVKNLYDYGLIPKMIVVRVDNYEFGFLTPTRVESDPNSGRADQFIKFFGEELFSFMDTEYRTHPFRIVFSNSWGAMFAAYAILSNPQVFDAAIASIPWIPYDGENKHLINNVDGFLNRNEYHNFLYMTMGNESEILPDLDAFMRVLKRMPKKGLEWEYHYWPDEDHTSTPYRSIYVGLRSLFSGWNEIPPDVAFQGLQEIKKHEASLKQKFGYDIGLSPSALRRAGQEHQRNKDYDKALAIFEYAIEGQPNDVFAHVTLGRAYEECSRLRPARAAFQKAYDLAVTAGHPQVKWIKGFLDRIDQKIKDAENRKVG